jgi:hypothetical protein
MVAGSISDKVSDDNKSKFDQEEIKRKFGNACYHSVQKLLSFHPLSKSVSIKIYKTLIFLCFCVVVKLGLLTFREERRLRVFANRVLRRIFGSKRGEVTGEWRKLHNEELRYLHSLPSIIWMIKSRRMRRAGSCSMNGEKRNACRILMGKPEGKRPLGRPSCSLMDNIKMNLWEIGWNCMDWLGLSQDGVQLRALVNMAMNFLVP